VYRTGLFTENGDYIIIVAGVDEALDWRAVYSAYKEFFVFIRPAPT